MRSVSSGPFAVISWTRFSPKSRSPAAHAVLMRDAGNVLVTATRVTSASDRPDCFAADRISPRTSSSLSSRSCSSTDIPLHLHRASLVLGDSFCFARSGVSLWCLDLEPRRHVSSRSLMFAGRFQGAYTLSGRGERLDPEAGLERHSPS